MDPYDEGFEAYHDNVAIHENPYEENSDEAVEWDSGWLYAEETDND